MRNPDLVSARAAIPDGLGIERWHYPIRLFSIFTEQISARGQTWRSATSGTLNALFSGACASFTFAHFLFSTGEIKGKFRPLGDCAFWVKRIL